MFLFDQPDAHVESMTMQKWIEHGRIVGDLAKLIQDPTLYKLLLLLTLTKTPSHSRRHNDLAHLHAAYLCILHRRQKWIQKELLRMGAICSFPADADETISKVSKSLSDVDRLSSLHLELAQIAAQTKEIKLN